MAVNSQVAWDPMHSATACRLTRILQVVCYILVTSVFAAEHDFSNTRDGWPDILWRRRGSDITYGWNVISKQYTTANLIGYSGGDPNWKIVGTGDFGGKIVNQTVTAEPDTYADILWRHTTQDLIGIWYLNGFSQIVGYALVNAAPGLNWQIVGGADLGQAPGVSPSKSKDGKTDIILEDGSGQIAIWLMDKWRQNVNYGTIVANIGSDKNVVAVADFGTPTSSTPDGFSDLIVSRTDTDLSTIWYLDGYAGTLGVNNIRKESDNTIVGKTFGNIDERFTGAGDFVQDFNGPLKGKNDLFREVGHGDEGLEFGGYFLGSLVSFSKCLAQCVDLDFSENFFDGSNVRVLPLVNSRLRRVVNEFSLCFFSPDPRMNGKRRKERTGSSPKSERICPASRPACERRTSSTTVCFGLPCCEKNTPCHRHSPSASNTGTSGKV